MLSPQDVAALKYRAPRLAVDCLSQALQGPPHDPLILDVACGTGLVAVEVRSDTVPCLPFSTQDLQHTTAQSALRPYIVNSKQVLYH